MTAVGELTLDQRMTAAEIRLNRIEASLAGAIGALPEVLTFEWPIGTDNERCAKWPGAWFVTVGYAQAYPPSMHRADYHTGDDFNLPAYGDSGKPVYATADGIIRFVGYVSAEWLRVVSIEHTLEDGRKLYSRSAHIDPLAAVQLGFAIKRGTMIGTIADYPPKGVGNDHLHFDLAWRDLGAWPGDWPNTDLVRLKQDYIDPEIWISARLP
jgi:murein DD-endopeptidase MepM/ murein hydrolase activator NlpD